MNGSSSSNEATIAPSSVPDRVAPARKQGTLFGFLLGGLILTLGAIGGFRWWGFTQTHITTDNAQIRGHLSPVSSKIPATIQKVLVKEGDYVRAGQPLLILEDQDLILKERGAVAAVASAQAQWASLDHTLQLTQQTNPLQVQQSRDQFQAKLAAIAAGKAAVAQAQAYLASQRAAVAQTQSNLAQAQADYGRYLYLYRAGAIAAQQLDFAKTIYDQARVQVRVARKQVEQAQAQVTTAAAQYQRALAEGKAADHQVQQTQVSGQTVTIQEDQRKQAQAQIHQAIANLALARQQLSYRVIRAPVSGYVGQLAAQVGQKVQMGQALMAVVPLDTQQIYVEANFKETALGKLRLGERAQVAVDAYPGEQFGATVAGISPATGSSFALLPPDNATGNFNKVVQWVPVRLVFDVGGDPQHRLRPGLNVTVTVNTQT